MATLEEFFMQGIERKTKLQEESFPSVKCTEAMMQQLEELRASIPNIDAPIVNLYECHLEDLHQVMGTLR